MTLFRSYEHVFGETQDWIFMDRLTRNNDPSGTVLVAGDIASIGYTVTEGKREVLRVTGVTPGAHVTAPFTDQDWLGALRTENWNRDATGYNFLGEILRSALPATIVGDIGGKRFQVRFDFTANASKWGDFTRVYDVRIEGGTV